MKAQKYSKKTREKAKEILLNHFEALNYSLMELTEMKPSEFQKIVTCVLARDNLLIDKLLGEEEQL